MARKDITMSPAEVTEFLIDLFEVPDPATARTYGASPAAGLPAWRIWRIRPCLWRPRLCPTVASLPTIGFATA